MPITKIPGGGRQGGYITGTIPAGSTSTTAIDIEGYGIAGLSVPSMNTASLTFEASNTATGTFYGITSSAGTLLSLTTATGGKIISSDALTFLAGYRYIKVVATASQTASVDLTFILKA